MKLFLRSYLDWHRENSKIDEFGNEIVVRPSLRFEQESAFGTDQSNRLKSQDLKAIQREFTVLEMLLAQAIVHELTNQPKLNERN